MARMLPTSPRTATARPKPVVNAAQTEPMIGGVVQRKARLGSRWSLEATLPAMSYADAMAWTADLAASETEELILLWPQPRAVVGDIGAPVVNGAGQGGTTLQVRGAPGGYVYKKGLFFSLIDLATDRRYLHQITVQAAANGAGLASLTLWPMLRVSPQDGALMEFYEPKIQGWAQLNPSWDIDTAMNVGLSLTITEAR